MKQKSLKIVHCFRSPIGGVFRHIRDLAAMQNAAGYQVGVICELCDDGMLEQMQFAELQQNLKLGLHRITISRKIGLSDISALRATRKIFKILRPDIVHGHGAKGGTYARIGATWLNNNKALRFYSPHGGSLHHDADSLAGKLMFAAERWQEKMTDGLIFVSAYEQSIYYKKIGIPRCPHKIIRNGISEEEFAPVDIVPDAADFLFIGMMRDIKGPDLFIRALSELHSKQRSADKRLATAVMIGDGPEKRSYQALASQLGLTPYLQFYDGMPVREALKHGKYFVMSSRAESLPYIVLEVLAAGRSMIATNVGGISEILGKNNIALCPPESTAITAKMEQILIVPTLFSESMPDGADLRTAFNRRKMFHFVENFYLSR